MSDSQRKGTGTRPVEESLPDLAELCRIHEIGLDLIDRSHDVDELLDRVLEEYESRLASLPSDALDARGKVPHPEGARKLHGLVMFATQAAALKEKAVAARELKRRAAELEKANTRLVAVLDEAQRSRARLDGVLSALPSGVVILQADGTFLTANAAARSSEQERAARGIGCGRRCRHGDQHYLTDRAASWPSLLWRCCV